MDKDRPADVSPQEPDPARPAASSSGEASRWAAPSQPLNGVVVGLGNRGLALGSLARRFSGVDIVWGVDRSVDRLAQADGLLGGIRQATDIAEPFADPRVDFVVVAVPDHLHRPIAESAFRAGKHVFLEKPIATTLADTSAILSSWRRSGRVLQLGYVLRQAPFYAAIRALVRDNVLGPVRIASLSEQLNVRHGGSFMRRWHARKSNSGGLIVHKGCHDLDIVCWLLDDRPIMVSSFGGLEIFGQAAPAEFCSRCERRDTCPYVDTGLHERRTAAEAADPTAYGLDRCVFREDKDIVDNQVVSFELERGTRGTFHLAMQGPLRSERRITLIGDRGRLDGVFEDGRFTVVFVDPGHPPLEWRVDGESPGGHGGGDYVTMHDFLNACAGRAPAPVVSVEDAGRGLVFALAAEQARIDRTVVRLGARDFVLC